MGICHFTRVVAVLRPNQSGVDGERTSELIRALSVLGKMVANFSAVKAGKLLRDAFSEHVFLTADRGMSGRLTSALSKVVRVTRNPSEERET